MESASHKLLEAAVYRTLHAHSFSRSSSQASLVLTDLFTRYLSLLSTTCAKYAQHAGRTSMSVRDAIGALDELGVSVDELSEYCSSEGKELSRYAIHSARRVEDLNEFRAQLADGLRQDRDDAIPLYYALYNPSSEEEDEEEDEGEEDEQLEEQRVGDDVMQIVSTKLLAPPMPPPPSITPFGHYPVPPRISTPPLPPSPISNPSSPSARKRPRKGSWQPPDHIPDFLPPFPTTDPVASQSPDGTPQPMQTQFEPLLLPATESLKIERSLLNLSQPVTSSAASDYLLQVPYSQSSLSGVAEWHLPSTQPPPPQHPHQRNPALPTPQTEHSLVAAYHHILTHPPPANGSAPTPARHKVAMALLSQTQNIPRWDPPDTLYASVAPCTPRLAVIGPSYPMAIDGGSDTKGKVDGKEKEIKFPPTLSRPVAFNERLTPLVSQQLSRIPDLARVVLPPSIYTRTSRLTHPPPLQRGSKLLVYGNGIPAPWNANALPAPEVPPPTPGGAKLKDKEKDTSEPAAKPVLPDARLYATWDYEPKDFRIPLAPTIRSRARMGSTQGGVVSLSRPKPHKTS